MNYKIQVDFKAENGITQTEWFEFEASNDIQAMQKALEIVKYGGTKYGGSITLRELLPCGESTKEWA